MKALEDRWAIQESNMAVLDKLEAMLNKKCEKIEDLENRVDNGEKYSRRLCLRMYNIDLAPAETKESCIEKVEKVLTELDCGVSIDSVDRAYRIRPGEKKAKGKETQQMIFKFQTFIERTAVYSAKKKAAFTKIRVDLTQKRFSILREATTLQRSTRTVLITFLPTLIAVLSLN